MIKRLWWATLFVLGVGFVLMLNGCGTQLSMDGSVCGQPINIRLADQKDRASFRAQADCSDGSSVLIESSESTPNAAQAEAVADLARAVSVLAGDR